MPESRDEQQIERMAAEIDPGDSHSILFFGCRVQEQLTELSNRMLDGVLNDDVSAAGQSLGELVAAIEGFDVEQLDPNRKQGFFARLFAKGKPLAQFLHGYDETRKRVDAVAVAMERQKTRLLTNIATLDRLYGANQAHVEELEHYIAAGDERLRRLNDEELPALERDNADSDQGLAAQRLRDLRNAAYELTRRLEDLRLSRQVSLQGLPSIRLVQDNNKDLVAKIDSALANTLPLWRQQLALVIGIFRAGRPAQAGAQASELELGMTRGNAASLRTIGTQVRAGIDQGIYDIGVVKQVNQTLTDSIQEGLQLVDAGSRARNALAGQLQTMEGELRQSLPAASAP